MVWRQKTLIAGIAATFLVVSALYVFLATPWYKAEVLLVPAEERSTQMISGDLGGLASLAGLAGISVGGSGNVESIAVLRSRDFARSFIEDYELMTVLLADDWDAEAGQWKESDPEDWPDIRDAIEYFDENVRRVSEDPITSLVTFSIEWTEPEVAAEWANLLVKRLNENMRQRALAEAEINVEYLRNELSETDVVTLKESVIGLLEAELQKLMLARGNEEFAFKVIDAAQVPKDIERPQRLIIIAVAVILGVVFGVFIVLIRHVFSQQFSEQQLPGQ